MSTGTERRLTVEEFQAVTIDGRYAYVWTGEGQLAVGDRVVLPGTEWTPSWTGTVTELGSTYSGFHRSISGRVTE